MKHPGVEQSSYFHLGLFIIEQMIKASSGNWCSPAIANAENVLVTKHTNITLLTPINTPTDQEQ